LARIFAAVGQYHARLWMHSLQVAASCRAECAVHWLSAISISSERCGRSRALSVGDRGGTALRGAPLVQAAVTARITFHRDDEAEYHMLIPRSHRGVNVAHVACLGAGSARIIPLTSKSDVKCSFVAYPALRSFMEALTEWGGGGGVCVATGRQTDDKDGFQHPVLLDGHSSTSRPVSASCSPADMAWRMTGTSTGVYEEPSYRIPLDGPHRSLDCGECSAGGNVHDGRSIHAVPTARLPAPMAANCQTSTAKCLVPETISLRDGSSFVRPAKTIIAISLAEYHENHPSCLQEAWPQADMSHGRVAPGAANEAAAAAAKADLKLARSARAPNPRRSRSPPGGVGIECALAG